MGEERGSAKSIAGAQYRCVDRRCVACAGYVSCHARCELCELNVRAEYRWVDRMKPATGPRMCVRAVVTRVFLPCVSFATADLGRTPWVSFRVFVLRFFLVPPSICPEIMILGGGGGLRRSYQHTCLDLVLGGTPWPPLGPAEGRPNFFRSFFW